MAIEAEALLALSEKATKGPWEAGSSGNGSPCFVYSDDKTGSAIGAFWFQYVWSRDHDEMVANAQFVSALVSAYRDGSLIHRSALAEDTARAAEGWETIQNCPSDGRLILVFGGPWYLSPAPKEADGDWWRTSTARGLGAAPTHWRPLPAPPAPPRDKEAAHANR